MKVWITKYALSSGIFSEESYDCGPGAIKLNRPDRYTEYFHGADWHLTQEGALIRANEMRVKKIAALHKQIAKLEKLTF